MEDRSCAPGAPISRISRPGTAAPVTIALSGPHFLKKPLPLLSPPAVTEDVEKSRKRIFDTNRPDVRVVLVRASGRARVRAIWRRADLERRA